MDDTAQGQQIARSATIVSIGNVLSRVMGLAREAVIADVFGASGAVSAYTAASQVPLTLYEMLVGGMISSALVPTFGEYAAQERRDELWHISSLLFTLAALVLGVLLLLLELGAPLITLALVRFDAPLQAETTRLLRIVLLSVLFLGLSGIARGLCHALQRFALPAFTAVVFNASIVIVALIVGPRWVVETENPSINDIRVGDIVAGRVVSQSDGTLLATTLVVVPSQAIEENVLGKAIGIEDGTITVEDQRGTFQVLTDDETLFLVERRQVRTLAVGLVIGAALQVLFQLPALRDMRFRPTLDLRHPVLRHILRLYLPVILSLVVAGLGVVLDRNLASRTGASSISWMRYATTLIQFPLGLISMAIATAILPTLARLADPEQGDPESMGDSGGRNRTRFRATLASGLRLVLVLTIPAAIGLLVLARPLVALFFQHGDFDASDTVETARALRYYLIGLTFAAVDQPLVFSFYARKDTWRPALVGILGVGLYLIVALSTIRTLGMIGLILANGAQLAGHAAVMVWLFQRQVGTLRGYDIGQTSLKSLVASAVMGGAVYGVIRGVESWMPAGGLTRWTMTVIIGGGVGMGIYLACCALLRVPELGLLRTLIRQATQKATVHRQQP